MAAGRLFRPTREKRALAPGYKVKYFRNMLTGSYKKNTEHLYKIMLLILLGNNIKK